MNTISMLYTCKLNNNNCSERVRTNNCFAFSFNNNNIKFINNFIKSFIKHEITSAKR